MSVKKLLAVGLIGALVVGVAGCKKEAPDLEAVVEQIAPFERTINGHQYKFEGNKVTEMTSDEDNQATYGIISDAHGEAGKAKFFAEEFPILKQILNKTIKFFCEDQDSQRLLHF